jgi:hypothetical protein
LDGGISAWPINGGRTEDYRFAAANGGGAVEAVRGGWPETFDSVQVGLILKQNGKRNMGKMPILAKDRENSEKDPEQPLACYPLNRPLPAFYMADYSVLALLVDNLEETVRVLRGNEFPVGDEAGDLEVTISHPGQLREIIRLLDEKGIDCQINDVISGIYQG